MVGIQIVSARIGRVTGEGLAGNLRRCYPAWLLYAIISLLVVANTINIGVDFAAMAAAYAVAGAFGWPKGLDLNLTMGNRFYGIIAASTLIGAGIGLGEVDPIKALYWAAVVNGVISVPIMVVMMLMAQRRDVMGPFVVTTRLKYLGWAATAAMALAVAVMSAGYVWSGVPKW